MERRRLRVVGTVLALVCAALVASFADPALQHIGAGSPRVAEAAASQRPLPTTPTSTTGPGRATPAANLVPWTGPVEHLFFHTLVIRPELAFTDDSEAQGFRDYFVTVGEFRAILDGLYANGWSLVDIHRAVAGTVRVPPGRRPLVLSEDDVNYYDYSRPRGLGWRLVLAADGAVRVEVRDDRGVRVTDEDLVPIVDAFVERHPDFSAEGAKGVLAVTGYEGVLGERVGDSSSPDRAASVERARAVAERLKATGWTFASHSFGHIDLVRDGLAMATRDAARWAEVVSPVVGPTDVYIYPFGAAPPLQSATVGMLRDLGFTIQCGIDAVARLVDAEGVHFMWRRHIDGIAFRDQRRALEPFFDVAAVEDVGSRGDRNGAAGGGTRWRRPAQPSGRERGPARVAPAGRG